MAYQHCGSGAFEVDDDPKASHSFYDHICDARVRLMAATQRPGTAEAIRISFQDNGATAERTFAAHNAPETDEKETC